MLVITRILRSLGNEGAISNVRSQLDRHTREAWLVASLARRLERQDQTAPVTASAA